LPLLGWIVKYPLWSLHPGGGSNVNTARRSGVPVNKVIWGIFAIVGACAALSGQFSAQVVTATLASPWLELSAIAVVVVVNSPDRRAGTLIGTLLGVLVAMINNGLNLLNVPVLYQQVTIGSYC
jgi:ribose transport system permease protein